MSNTNLDELASELHDRGYNNLTHKPNGDTPSISGGVSNIDLSDVSKSVPEGDDTGPFKTMDSPEEAIPEDIRDLCDSYGVEVTVLGHGPDRLHLYISE